MNPDMYTIVDLPFSEAENKIQNEWISIVHENNLNPSMYPGWIRCTSTAFGIFNNLRVSILLDKDEVIALIPYYYTTRTIYGIKLKSLELAGNLVSYHHELSTKCCHDKTISSFLDYQYKKHKWQLFHAQDILHNSFSYKCFTHYAHKMNYYIDHFPTDSSPYLKLENTWETQISNYARKFRYKVNRRERELASNEHYKIEWFAEEADCQKLLDDIFNIENKSWKTDANMDITSNQVEMEYYKILVPFLKQSKLLFANVLYFDSSPVAYNLCYLNNQHIGQIKTSFDNEFKDISPGSIILEDMLRKCIQYGHKEFDFLGDIMPHKTLWTKDIREHENIIIYGHGLLPKIAGCLKSIKKMVFK